MPLRLTMRDRLEEAMGFAARANPQAQLVRIFGLRLHEDGKVRLGTPGDFLSRWEYAFMDDPGGETPPTFLTVLYWMAGAPIITENAGNVTRGETFDEEILPDLKDSDELAAIFSEQPGYHPLGGTDSDFIVYSMRRALDPIADLGNWKGHRLRLDPLTGDVLLGGNS